MFSAKSIAIVRAFAIVTGGLLVLLLSTSIAFADSFPGSVPKANCGPGDHTESGFQGETTVQERFSGDSQRAYNCNLELVGQEPQDEFQGAFSQDGPAYSGECAYYGTDRAATLQGIKVIDVSDPQHPRVSAHLTDTPAALNPQGFAPGVHEGTRVYAGQIGSFPFTGGGDGLVIEDVSDYQFRRPNPQIRIVSKLFWTDQGTAEAMIPVKIRGRPHIVSTDEAGGASGAGGWAAACARGASPFGYPNIIDVTDETNPKIVAKLRLEVNDPANCSALLAETPPDVPGTAPGTNLPAISGTTNYSEETCVADNPKNAKMLACSFQNAQLRVFDIRDPTHAKEIAYWKAGAVRTRVLPASGSWAPGSDRTVDKIAHWVRWVVAGKGKGNGNVNGRGNVSGNPTELQLWTISDGHGFQVLRFTDNFKAQHKDLFQDE